MDPSPIRRPPKGGGAPKTASLRWRPVIAVLLLVAVGWYLAGGDLPGLLGSVLQGTPAEATARCAAQAPADAVPLRLPLGNTAQIAELSGRTVCLTQALLVAEVYELGSRRRVLVAAEPRPTADTPAEAFGLGTLRVQAGSRPGAAYLAAGEDPWTSGRRAQGSGPWGLADGDLRSGDLLHGLHGRLRGSGDGLYLEVEELRVEQRNPRPVAPPALGQAGDLRVAFFNAFNWFTTLGARGAGSSAELERQADKLIATLMGLDADVLALAEVENGEAALADLVARLNRAQTAAGRPASAAYRAVPTPPQGSGHDEIRLAMLYRPEVAALVQARSDTDRVHDRPPLAATFDAGGERFTVIAAHHKSKGGCPVSGDVDRGSGCWDLRRDAQSQALMDFAAALSAQVGDPDVLVVGDLNAYRHEAPTRRFADEGWRLLVDDMPPEAAYSYVYFGRAGALDHAVASASLAGQVSGAAFWAVNADEVPGADARLPTPFRASDHDPLLITLELGR